MTLAVGTRLGPFEILSPIGAGGMGEVYKAADTRLNRYVAVKVLVSQFSQNADLKQRFEREAQAIAALNHPHICVIHDVGHQDSIDYLVMEFLDGETLADRLKKGPLPLDQALRYAIEIADALDKAHRQGITHRDLKPGNIMLTASGAKLLDFGLAKLKAGAASTAAVSQLPTREGSLTERGTILGTFQYMAPEQLEGEEAGAKSDIFAFGVVLYEMLTGRHAFEGRSQASLIAAILSSHPPRPSALQSITPAALDHIVETCMAKNPDDRFHSAHDLEVQLKWIAETRSPADAPKPASAPGMRRQRLAWSAAVLAGLVISSIATWWITKPPPQNEGVKRVQINVPATAPFWSGAAISPDGTRFVYSALVSSAAQLRIRRLETDDVAALAGTDGANTPFFSPDGQWVGFYSNGKLRKVSVEGGAATALADGEVFWGGTWGEDGTIIAALHISTGLVRISANGGEPQTVTKLNPGELYHRWPSFLPGNKAVLFAANSGASWDDAQIVVQSLQTGERHTVAAGGSSPRYVSTGHVIFSRSGSLFAVPFDLKSLTASGSPIPVATGIATSSTEGWADCWISGNGSMVYLPGQPHAIARNLVWVDRKGTVQTLPIAPRGFEEPRFSPDGQRVALTIREGNADTWVLDLMRGALTRLTFGLEEDESPIWTPDGKRVTFSSSRGGKRQAMWKAADGSGSEEVLFETEGRHQHLGSWTPDGETLVADENGAATAWDIYVTPYKKKEKSRPFLNSTFTEWASQLSPDGRWLAYTSNESGRTEVFVQSFPDPGQRYQISTEGGEEPVWNSNERELFYRNADKMMVVGVETKPAFKPAVPRLLFEGRFMRIGWQRANYDVSRDGQRFLMIKGEEQALPTTFNLVINWFAELSRRAGGR